MKALLINPRSDNRMSTFSEAMGLTGKIVVAPPLGLLTVAALLPKDWELELLDLGIRSITEDHWRSADLVMVSGNLLHRKSMLEIIREATRRGKPIAAGGPYVSSVPEEALAAGADFVVVGEGESAVPLLLDALQAGEKKGFFETDVRPAMSLSPFPRMDLLSDMERYHFMSVQTTRGCPFNCEFCDVISLNGRVPRFKSPDRVLAELDALHALGWRGSVFLADDNFIGNKANARAILRGMITWQEDRGHPFSFFTQASVDLGQDKELVDLMTAANFGMVLLGVETPDTETLARTRKTQNVRNPLLESITNITRNGLPVLGSFMLGFDGETKGAGNRIAELVEKTDMPVVLPNTLYAIPRTGLWDRLEKEGRLLEKVEGLEGFIGGGLNFVPTRPASEVIEEFEGLWDYLYEPSRFLSRTYRCYLRMRPTRRATSQTGQRYTTARPQRADRPLRDELRDLWAFVIIVWRMGIRPPQRVQFWKQLIGMFRQNPSRMWQYVATCASGLDMFRIRQMILDARRTDQQTSEVPHPGPSVVDSSNR